MNNIQDMCFFRQGGKCGFIEQIRSSNYADPFIFYAYDYKSTRKGALPPGRAVLDTVKNTLHQLNKNIKIYEFDRNHAGGSSDWQCLKLCLNIRRSAVFIADITPRKINNEKIFNPNVLFETGLALSMGKKVFLVTSDKEKSVPTDFQQLDIFYCYEDERLLKALEEAFNQLFISPGIELIPSKAIKKEKLLDIEKIPGDSLILSDYHNYLFRPWEILEQIIIRGPSDGLLLEDRINYSKVRWDHLMKSLHDRNEKHVCIFEKQRIMEYFKNGLLKQSSKNPQQVNKEELNKEICFTIDLLKAHYPKLMIAFTDNTIPYGMLIKTNSCVFIDSKSNDKHSLCGLVISYREAILYLEQEFWKLWQKIPEERLSLKSMISEYENFKELTQ